MAEFIGVFIPKDILSIKELNLTEKILLTQVIPLCVTEPCYASNQFFAERLGVTETTISTTLKSLDDKGYLQTILDRKNGNKRTIEIFYYKDTLFKIFKDPYLKSLNTLFKNLKDPLKNSYIAYLNNLKTLFKNLNFIYKDESKDYSKEESKEDNKQDTEFSKNENSQPSQKEIELALEIENLKSENQSLKDKQKKAPQAGGAVKNPKSETDNKETYGEHENVRLTQVEHDKLLTQHGETILCEILKKLSNYKLSTGKKYKSDYGAINTWVVDSVRKDLKSQPQAKFTPNFTGLNTAPPVDKYKQASEAVKQKMRDSITANMYATN